MSFEILDAAEWPVTIEWPVGGKKVTVKFTVFFKELSQQELGELQEAQNLLSYELQIELQKKRLNAHPKHESVLELLATYEQWAQEARDRGIQPLQLRDCVLRVVDRVGEESVKLPRGRGWLDWSNEEDRDLFLSFAGVVPAIWAAYAQDFSQRSWVKNSESSDDS